MIRSNSPKKLAGFSPVNWERLNSLNLVSRNLGLGHWTLLGSSVQGASFVGSDNPWVRVVKHQTALGGVAATAEERRGPHGLGGNALGGVKRENQFAQHQLGLLETRLGRRQLLSRTAIAAHRKVQDALQQ